MKLLIEALVSVVLVLAWIVVAAKADDALKVSNTSQPPHDRVLADAQAQMAASPTLREGDRAPVAH